MTIQARNRAGAGFSSQKLVIVLGVALLSACALEAWLWVRYPLDEPVYALDERTLYRPNPGARTLHMPTVGTGGEPSVWRFNAQGFRGPDLAPRSSSSRRVVVYGDSFVHATSTPLAETFVVRVAAELTKRGTPAHAINAGVPGYGPDQSLLHFERDVAELAPDLVVFVAAPETDFGDLSRNEIFVLDGAGGVRERAPAIDARYAGRMARWDELARGTFLQRVASYWTARALEYCERRAPAEPTDWAAIDRVRAAAFADALGLAFSGREHAGEDERALARRELELMTHVLSRFQRGCASRGIEFYTVVIPPAREVRGARASGAALDDAAHPLSAACARAAHSAGSHCLDLFVPFATGDVDALYLPGIDTHWSSAGQRLAAELFAERATAGDRARTSGTR